jgi:hypothetical protein
MWVHELKETISTTYLKYGEYKPSITYNPQN